MVTSQVTQALYVGADNDTGQLDMSRISDIVSKLHQGFTVWQAQGFWQGMAEPSAVVMISDTAEAIGQTVATLKSELHQDAIGVQTFPGIEMR